MMRMCSFSGTLHFLQCSTKFYGKPQKFGLQSVEKKIGNQFKNF